MSSKTKIVVLRMKEIIYTAIFIGFGILLILLLLVCSAQEKAIRLPPQTRSTYRVSTPPPSAWDPRRSM